MHTDTSPRRPYIISRDDVTEEEWEDMLDARDEARREAIAEWEAMEAGECY